MELLRYIHHKGYLKIHTIFGHVNIQFHVIYMRCNAPLAAFFAARRATALADRAVAASTE